MNTNSATQRTLRNIAFTTLVLTSLSLLSCGSADSMEPARDRQSFNDYWYSGKAEITRYELSQARYGEMRKGDAVLIFVTEDFLKDKQVKYDFGDRKNVTSVLKLNFVRKFYTGIYPYSVMTSIFTPVNVDRESSLKLTSSSQEWCGQTFLQLNARGGNYRAQLRSYFQSEGDQNFEIPRAFLEDEIWTRIRLAPESLPTGKIEIIPAVQFTRFRHVPVNVEQATATTRLTRDAALSEDELVEYTVRYTSLKRTLTIKYEKTFPHRILAWEETYPSGFGKNARMMTTTAVRTKTIRLDYWTKNKESDSHYREELGVVY